MVHIALQDLYLIVVLVKHLCVQEAMFLAALITAHSSVDYLSAFLMQVLLPHLQEVQAVHHLLLVPFQVLPPEAQVAHQAAQVHRLAVQAHPVE